MSSPDAKKAVGLLCSALMALAVPARADIWDFGPDADNGIGTDNAPFHGSEQVHGLSGLPGPVADQDWYLTSTREFSSYQFVVDGMTGELDLTPASVQRLDSTGAVVENAIVTDAGGGLSLTWLRGAGLPQTNFVRVQGAACGAACDQTDTYRARYYDTTYTIPRFNNSGTQSTVLLVQNATDRSCTVTFFFLNAAGVLSATASAGTVSPYRLVVLPTSTVAPNLSGSVRIAHTCGYGGLSGKAVSVEPSTGFAFDTLMQHRPH
jgi:hypothetical protein